MILGPDWLAVLSHEVLLVVLELAGLALLEDVLGPALAFTLAELPSPTVSSASAFLHMGQVPCNWSQGTMH